MAAFKNSCFVTGTPEGHPRVEGRNMYNELVYKKNTKTTMLYINKKL